MNSVTEMWATLISMLGLIALAAVLVSRNSQTPAVAGSVFGGVAQDLGAAEAPVLGNSGAAYQPDFSSHFGT